MNRALRVAWPALTIVVALAVSIAVTVSVSEGSSVLLAVRAAAVVLLALTIATVLGTTVAAGAEAEIAARGRLLDVAAGGAAAWTVVAAATAFLLYLEQAPAPGSPSFGPGLVTFVLDVDTGRAWLVAAGLAAVLTAALIAVRSRRGTVWLALATVVAVVPVAVQGPMPGAPLAVERGVASAGLVQLVALGCWIGLLAVRPSRVVPVVAFGAVAIGILASLPALIADGDVSPVAAAGAVAVTAAGGVAVVALAVRADLRAPQLLLLGVGTGLAAAAAVTRSVQEVPARSTPAQILTGSPLPARPSFGALAGSWSPDAAWLVVAVALLAGYLVAVRRLRTPWPPIRTLSWTVGLLLLVWLTCGGPAVYAPVLVAVELVRLVALLLVVPTLLGGGAPLRLLAAAMPARRVPDLAGPLRLPVPALVATLVAAGALLGTGLLRWSLMDPIGTETALAGALVCGALLVRATSAADAPARGAVVVLVVLLAVEAATAVLLAANDGLLVADWYGAMGWGTDALAAQRGAAALVLPVAVLPTLALLVRAARSSRRRPALTRSEAATA